MKLSEIRTDDERWEALSTVYGVDMDEAVQVVCDRRGMVPDPGNTWVRVGGVPVAGTPYSGDALVRQAGINDGIVSSVDMLTPAQLVREYMQTR